MKEVKQKQHSEVVISELHVKKVAALSDAGLVAREIAQELGLSIWQVKRIMARPDFKATIQEMGNKAVSEAAAKWRLKVSNLIPKMLKVIEDRLDAGDLEAVKVGLKSLGIGSETPQVGDTSISIVLPGAGHPDPVNAATPILAQARPIPAPLVDEELALILPSDSYTPDSTPEEDLL